jgi:hypothetical protein
METVEGMRVKNEPFEFSPEGSTFSSEQHADMIEGPDGYAKKRVIYLNVEPVGPYDSEADVELLNEEAVRPASLKFKPRNQKRSSARPGRRAG